MEVLLFGFDKIKILIFLLLFFALNFAIFYDRRKLQSYVMEFKDESEEQRKRGNYMIRFYIFGSYMFFLMILLLLSNLFR